MYPAVRRALCGCVLSLRAARAVLGINNASVLARWAVSTVRRKRFGELVETRTKLAMCVLQGGKIVRQILAGSTADAGFDDIAGAWRWCCRK